ncbi:MAG: hypothetical protein COV37_05015 [Bdellovibrio sp. CG11_big_fil_rev_8_21_14_0_20_39_38]|nr:MAG: hypothetical protein COW78_10630 [Bdellovibrio sp. CG22_combo_CG10-13_8_21_14_all_39_27]PIR36107.1 MAG: hypothetical protein COV37_05015 [Bdellovibrio sp. CG11_big_fil_rev_8_21_14_0_20_39_38]
MWPESDSFLSIIGSYSSVISLIIAGITLLLIFAIKERYLSYKIDLIILKKLKDFVDLINNRGHGKMIATNIRQDLSDTLSHIIGNYSQGIFGKFIHKKLIASVTDCLQYLEKDANCKSSTLYLKLKTIEEVLEKRPELEHATK